MSDTSWPRIRSILEEALERPLTERDTYLEQACDGDAELRAEVERLLGRDSGEGDAFLEPPASREAFDVGAEPGTRVGSFRLLHRLGSGGMGTVFAAEQDQPRRTVALKMLSLGFSSPSARRRFQHESEILGRLRHPGIAQVYEVGLHDAAGLQVPYFAMEYVEDALPIDAYAARADLTLHERLRLFRRVCDAVHHGHEKGVVHRDLKPGNILVDREGQSKVIDFGIARVTEGDETARTRATRTGQILGTLQYMSPEQIAGDGDRIDIRSDVYALGVVLYELLCGRPPYDLGEARLGDAARIVQEEPPHRPSTIVRTLRGDVEAILLKALAKEPSRRYSSAAALSDDVDRFLDARPIDARPPSAFYQARMFARRHRAVVGALSAVFLVLVGATAVSVRFGLDEARSARNARLAQIDAQEASLRAEAAAEAAAAAEALARTERDGALAARDAEAAARRQAEEVLSGSVDLSLDFLLAFFDRVVLLEGSTQLTADLVATVLAHLDFLDQRAAESPRLKYLLAQAHLRMASLLGGNASRNLGDMAGAAEQYIAALEIAVDLHEQDPDEPSHTTLLGSARVGQGRMLLEAGREEDAFLAIREGLRLYREAVAREPENAAIQLNMLDSMGMLVTSHGLLGRPAEAEAVALEGIAILERLRESAPDDPDIRRTHAGMLVQLADIVLPRSVEEADAYQQQGSRLLEELIAEDPLNTGDRASLGRSLEWRSNYAMRMGDDVRAEELARRAIDIYEKLLAVDPVDTRRPRQLAYSVFTLGEVFHMRAVTLESDAETRAGYWRSARECYVRSRDLLAELRDTGRLVRQDLHKPEEIHGFVELAEQGEREALATLTSPD